MLNIIEKNRFTDTNASVSVVVKEIAPTSEIPRRRGVFQWNSCKQEKPKGKVVSMPL